MAKRKAAENVQEIDDRLVAFAETLGRMAGTLQGRAEGLVDRKKLSGQLTYVRDTAGHLVEQLASLAPTVRRKKPTAPPKRVAKGRSGGTVDAPGKKHRSPMPADPREKRARSQSTQVHAARNPVSASRRRGRG